MEKFPRVEDFMFSNGFKARAIHIVKDTPPEAILAKLAFDPFPCAVIPVSGGAKDFPRYLPNNGFLKMHSFIEAVVEVAFNKRIMLVDGGTNTGVMQLIGSFFEKISKSDPNCILPPLIGFVPEPKVNYPGASIEGRDPKADSLDPNHSCFVLVNDVQEWGDEVDSMFALVNSLSARLPSVSLIVNGGLTTLKEAVRNARDGREIIVIEGSLRATRAIIAAINGATENELTKILFDKLDNEVSLIDVNDNQYKQKLDNALSDLKEIAQYNKITRFGLDSTPVELTTLVIDKLGLT